MKTKPILIVMMIFTLLSLTISATYAEAVDRPVDDGIDSVAIQSIIDSANDGDSLIFEEGGTHENISVTINKSLNLVGNNVSIFGTGVGSRIFTINGGGNYVNITGFNLYGGTSIHAENVANINISGNNISGATGNDAISLNNVNGVTIKNNVFNSTGNGTRDVIHIVNVQNALIENNVIDNCTRDCVSLASGNATGASTYNIKIINNTFLNGGTDGIYFGGGVEQVEIISNTFLNFTGVGINVERSSTNICILNNTFNGTNTSTAIRLVENNTNHNGTPTVLTNVTVAGNSINNNLCGIELYQVNDLAYWINYLKPDNNAFSGNTCDICVKL